MTTPTSPPLFWRLEPRADGTVLAFAIRGGARHWGLVLLGLALLCGGLYAMYWLVAGGDLTIAGYVFLLVPDPAELPDIAGEEEPG